MKVGIDYTGITTPFYCNDGKGNYLLHKRSKYCRDEQGKWDPGGGRLAFGYSPERNVLKEVKEEYGCIGKIQKQIPPHSIIRKLNGKRTHWLAIPFFILVKPKEVKINEPRMIEEIGWFKLSNFPEPLHPGFKHTLKKYRKYFEV